MVDSKENYKFDLGVKGLNSVIKIMSEKAKNHKKKMSKSLWFHLMELITIFVFSYALINPWQTIWGTKVESPPKWYQKNEFLDYDSDKEA